MIKMHWPINKRLELSTSSCLIL